MAHKRRRCNPRKSTASRAARASLGRYVAACQKKKRNSQLKTLLARANPKPTRKVSRFRGVGYSGANITHQGRRYVYVTTVLAKPEITRLIGTPLQRLGCVGGTKHGDLVWSYAGRLPKVRRNPVQHLDHAAYAVKVRRMTDAALRYTMKDASDAIKAMPYGEKAGYYADEIHACSGEMRRRQKGGSQETNPRRRRKSCRK